MKRITSDNNTKAPIVSINSKNNNAVDSLQANGSTLTQSTPHDLAATTRNSSSNQNRPRVSLNVLSGAATSTTIHADNDLAEQHSAVGKVPQDQEKAGSPKNLYNRMHRILNTQINATHYDNKPWDNYTHDQRVDILNEMCDLLRPIEDGEVNDEIADSEFIQSFVTHCDPAMDIIVEHAKGQIKLNEKESFDPSTLYDRMRKIINTNVTPSYYGGERWDSFTPEQFNDISKEMMALFEADIPEEDIDKRVDPAFIEAFTEQCELIRKTMAKHLDNEKNSTDEEMNSSNPEHNSKFKHENDFIEINIPIAEPVIYFGAINDHTDVDFYRERSVSTDRISAVVPVDAVPLQLANMKLILDMFEPSTTKFMRSSRHPNLIASLKATLDEYQNRDPDHTELTSLKKSASDKLSLLVDWTSTDKLRSIHAQLGQQLTEMDGVIRIYAMIVGRLMSKKLQAEQKPSSTWGWLKK